MDAKLDDFQNKGALQLLKFYKGKPSTFSVDDLLLQFEPLQAYRDSLQPSIHLTSQGGKSTIVEVDADAFVKLRTYKCLVREIFTDSMFWSCLFSIVQAQTAFIFSESASQLIYAKADALYEMPDELKKLSTTPIFVACATDLAGCFGGRD